MEKKMSTERAIKWLHSIQGFTFLSSLYIGLDSMIISGFVPAAFATFERDFGINSSYTAVIVTAYSVTKIFTIIPMTYYFGKGNVPRNLAKLLSLNVAGTFLSAIPYFIVRSQSAEIEMSYCSSEQLTCSDVVETRSSLVWFVILGQVLRAIGSSCQYTLIPAYINNNSASNVASLYMSFIYASGPIGAAVGFVWMGESVTTGVWGIPFIVAGFMLMSVFPPLYNFPLIGIEEELADVDEHIAEILQEAQDEIFFSREEFVRNSKEILYNRSWWAVALALSAEAFMLTGYQNLGPKYISSQFTVEPGLAGILMGVVLVPAGAFGQVLGGYIDSKRNKNLKQTARFSAFLALVALVLVLMMGFINCPTNYVQPLTEGCRDACNCEKTYNPVCLDGKATYYSPCDLGCVEFDVITNTFVNCTCSPRSGPVTLGVCESNVCGLLVPFLLLLFCAVFVTFMNNTPAIVMLLRSVSEEAGGLPLAFNDVVYKLTGSIPGAQIFAVAFDSTCIQFNEDSCGGETNCGYYDNNGLKAYFIFVFGGVGKYLSFAFFMFALYLLWNKEEDLGSRRYSTKRIIKAGVEAPPSAKMAAEMSSKQINAGFRF